MKNLLQISLLFAVMCLYHLVQAQQTTDQAVPAEMMKAQIEWQPAMVNTAGTNNANGVSVFYRTEACNSAEWIFLKFVNNNTEEVLIEWADGIYTQGGEWILNERNDKSRELKLGGGEQIEGSCDPGSNALLCIELQNLLGDREHTFRYAPSYIDVTKQ